MPPYKQAYRKFGDNYDLMEISFGRAAALLASVLFGSLVGKQLSHPYWGCVLASVLSIATFALISAVWVLVRLSKLEFKDRRLDPIQRGKIADYMRQSSKRQVRVIVTELASQEDGSVFAKDIKGAIAGAWDVFDKDNDPGLKAENFSAKTDPENKFHVGVSVYGARGDPEAKIILQEAFKRAKINLNVDTSIGYEDRIMLVVGLRETSLN